ncbi:MAG: hypothetical protein QM739_13710 [Propionivibrio sp.]
MSTKTFADKLCAAAASPSGKKVAQRLRKEAKAVLDLCASNSLIEVMEEARATILETPSKIATKASLEYLRDYMAVIENPLSDDARFSLLMSFICREAIDRLTVHGPVRISSDMALELVESGANTKEVFIRKDCSSGSTSPRILSEAFGYSLHELVVSAEMGAAADALKKQTAKQGPGSTPSS